MGQHDLSVIVDGSGVAQNRQTGVAAQSDRTQSVVTTARVDPMHQGTTSAIPDVSGVRAILTCASKRIQYVPIPALPASGYTDGTIDASTHVAKAELKAWPNTATEVNKLLTNISTNVADSTVDVSGNVGGLFSGSHSTRQYVIDFMKWRAEPLVTTNNESLGWARVGAGMRVVVDLVKDDGSMAGGLFGLAASAKADRVRGSISAELIGVDAPEFTQAMPFTVDLSEGNIQKVIEALAVVKTKLYDKETVLKPNLIARIECQP
ncbi:hypothetical protein AB6Q13_04325 [Ralstonia solanacearum]|uniref:Uncharacterized protein n=1 Tax=Ralstonia solanacearum TaxID=305 RepID=A0AAW5ZVC4_RALSL|nr:hypothetical protein [Ralstonia solanacearum]MDB0509868.1 hypothetical protein [Ralstonia solanacearum]MDB0567373.1 hypothetical protein [Ralstonia solanacearum]MDB0574012.1 hypothetical protein [Ralstonia solanacearum]MDB0577626.1 hypothetical protein [Ralstonia solanacearum]